MADTPQFSNADNALLWAKLDTISEDVSEIKNTVASINGRVRQTEIHAALCGDRWDQHKEEHKKNTRNDVIGAFLAVVGSLIGFQITK